MYKLNKVLESYGIDSYGLDSTKVLVRFEEFKEEESFEMMIWVLWGQFDKIKIINQEKFEKKFKVENFLKDIPAEMKKNIELRTNLKDPGLTSKTNRFAMAMHLWKKIDSKKKVELPKETIKQYELTKMFDEARAQMDLLKQVEIWGEKTKEEVELINVDDFCYELFKILKEQ